MTEPTITSEVIAAALGGAISSGVLYPLEVLKTKIQAQQKEQQQQENDNNSSTNNNNEEEDISYDSCQKQQQQQQLSMVKYAQGLYQREGLHVFLHGMGESAFQSAVEKSLYFFSYTILKQGVVRAAWTSSSSKEPKLGTLTSLALGYISEWSHLPITLPLDCWTTAIQTSTSPTASRSGKGQGAFSILLQLLSEKGRKGMYKGIQAYQVLCLKPALQYTVFEQLKRTLLAFQQQTSTNNTKKTALSAVEAFALGMIARAVATICVFPYLRAKVLMQVSASTASSKSSRTSTSMTDNSTDSTNETTERDTTPINSIPNTIPGIIQQLYQTGGVSELYRGVGPELTRGVLSAALMLMIKEQIATMVSTTMKNKKSSPTKK
mmetsp:Transcript_6554/g.9967  ORF Transcript_6554/g.9967 Transcript_6554/m.9967 type:complete len:379 (-) Transcript_6554:112-1248(-)